MGKKQSDAKGPNLGMEAWPNVIRAVESPLGLFALIAIIVCVVGTAFVLKGNNSPAVYVTLCTLYLLVGVVGYVLIKNPFALSGGHTRSGVPDAEMSPMQVKAVPSSGLKSRNELPSLPQEAAGADEMLIAAISGVSLVAPFSHFWEASLIKGCKLRILLLNPASPAIATWETLGRFPHSEVDIKRSLDNLGEIRRKVGAKGIGGARCEIRLSDTYLPYSLVVIDPAKIAGWAIVEYHAYRIALGERPHLRLSRESDRHWFEFYLSQFEEFWEASTEWRPTNEDAVGN